MVREPLKGVAGHTYGVAKNLLVQFLKLVEKMKVCIFENIHFFLKTFNPVGEDSARRRVGDISGSLQGSGGTPRYPHPS